MAVTKTAPKIEVDSKKCSGCRICEQICSFFHEREFNPRRARIRILAVEREGVYAPLLCNQCRQCISACKRGALSWDEAAGFIRVESGRCNACGLCIEACEQEAVFLDVVSGTVIVCDLCGGDPQCVRWCPTKALELRAG